MRWWNILLATEYTISVTIILLMHFPTARLATKHHCEICLDLVNSFKVGLEKTGRTKHYGGGDTAWEEAKLGAYEHSELRLVEIVDDSLCKSLSDSSNEKYCHLMAEEHEELIEEWWFKEKTVQANFYRWLCIDKIEVCCDNSTFGPTCEPCHTADKDPKRLCTGNGKCDGDGTRSGTGKCKCRVGYKGKACDACTGNYFVEVANETHITCTECDKSCKGCNGAGEENCKECATGYSQVEQSCEDDDECDSSEPPNPCTQRQYCLNTPGSFSCNDCAIECASCAGPGPENCLLCSDNYLIRNGKCMSEEEAAEVGGVQVTAEKSENVSDTEADIQQDKMATVVHGQEL